MATGDLHKFGTLYRNDTEKIKIPNYPWYKTPSGAPCEGDIHHVHRVNDEYQIKDSCPDDSYLIRWIEINDNNEKLFISDRNLLGGFKTEEFYYKNAYASKGSGEIITIDGSEYELFVLSGGSGENSDCEWNKYIVNTGNFPGLPYPSSVDNDVFGSEKFFSPHNNVWHWAGCYSACCEIIGYKHVCRGSSSVKNWTESTLLNEIGWRPVLKLLKAKQNSLPVITPDTKDFGNLTRPIDIEYTITDSDGDYFDVTVKIDYVQKEFYSHQKDKTFIFNLNKYWNELSVGSHYVQILADDKNINNEIYSRVYRFTKVNSSPVITPASKDYGVIYHPQDITYNISDSDNDNFSVTVKLNGTLKESYSNQTNKSYTFNMSQYWESLNLGYHTIEISATDTQNNTSTVQYTFYKGNRIPTIDPITLALGELKNPRDISYTINDVDNNELTVVVQLDYVEKERYTKQPNGIRTFQMSRYWNDIGVGNHTITITVTDIWNKSETVNYTFIKSSSPVNPPTILSPLNGARCESVCYVEFNIGKSPDGNSQTLQVQVADNESMQTNIKTFTALEKFVGNQWVSATSAINTDINTKFRIKVTGLSGIKYLRIKATDTSNGLYAYSKVIKIRVGNVLEIKTHPSKTPKCVNKIIVLLDLSADETVTKEILVSNNANDVNPTWEKYSPDQNGNHTFKNTSKTANEWAVSTKIKILANNSNHDIIIRAVGLGII